MNPSFEHLPSKFAFSLLKIVSFMFELSLSMGSWHFFRNHRGVKIFVKAF